MKLQVQVGAAADASFNNVFRSVTDAATAANRKISSEEKSQSRIHEALLKDRWAKQKLILQQQIGEEKAIHNHLRQMELARLRASVQATKTTAKQNRDNIVAEATKTTKELERLQRKEIADANRAGRQKAQAQLAAEREFARTQRAARPGRDIPYRMGYWASRNFSPITPMLSYAGRAASQMMRGAGIQTDVGSLVGNTVQNQKTVTDIVNSAYIPNAAGEAGKRQDPAKVMADVKAASNAAALDYGQGLEGLQKYTAKTGDLETGRKILKDMAVYARATGTAFEDMVDAAADVGNGLGDVADKDQKIKSVMLAISGMGKVGAVEIRDLAKQMAKIGAASGRFSGGAAANMITLTAMAQEARATGGAASATQAATSIASFANVWSKKARAKTFQQMTGRKLYNDNNEVMGPEQIILESLKATKGSQLKMGQIIGDVRARSATIGFEKIYNQAGGAKMIDFNAKTMPGMEGMAEKDKNGVYRVQAGLVAVVQEFDRLRGSTMTQQQAEEAFQASMKTTEAKVKLFNNAMQDTADKMAEKIFPEMEKIAPAAIKVVESFGGIASWLAGNPFAIIPTLLGAAILKAGIEQSIRVGIENVFRNFSGAVQPGFGGGAGVAGNLASAFVITSMAVTTLTVGMAMIDNWFTKKQEEQKKNIATDIKLGTSTAVLKKELEAGKVKEETIKKAQADAKAFDEEATKLERPAKDDSMFGSWDNWMMALSSMWEGKNPNKEFDKANKQHAEEAEKMRKKQVDVLLLIHAAVQQFNAQPKDQPKVNESGRTSNTPRMGTGAPTE